MNVTLKTIGLLLNAIVLVSSCGSSPGPDAISSHHAQRGAQISSCTVKCHNFSSTISPDPLVTNGTGTYGKHFAHVSNTGIACEKCHYNYINSSRHMNGRLDTGDPAALLVYFDSTNPAGSWIDDTGPSKGSCTSLNCHGTDTLDWYGTGTANFQNCGSCHSYVLGLRRRITGPNGDFGTNASIVSHHVTTSGDPVGTQCLVCHDQSSHTAGLVRLRNADTDTSIAYDPTNPVSLELFCLSCHDTDGAAATLISGGTPTSPFNDGSVLGGPPPNLYQAGNKIAGYWNGSGNTHKASGSLTCAGTGAPGTGCHGNNGKINMHGSSVKGLLTNKMNFQIPLTFDFTDPVSAFVYDNYKLCFDCHDSYPSVSKEVVLGYRLGGKYDHTVPFNWAPTPYYTSGIQSLFRDRYIDSSANYPSYWLGVEQPYNNDVWLADYAPLHNYHLLGDIPTWLSWKYRGDPARVGRITCTTCHNVHGTNGTVRTTYQEFGIRENFPYAPLGPDEYKMFDPITNYGDAVMRSYPINCNVSCHEIMGPSAYWYAPSDE
jgi:hypothetical protein